MRSVGIRELKARLSRHLEDVRRGEIILVTDRGKVVAELRPAGSAAEPVRDEFERRIQGWLRDGRVRVGPQNNPGWYGPSPLRFPSGTADRVLNDLRADSADPVDPEPGAAS